MKNIDKYYDAITEDLKSTNIHDLGCAVFDVRTGRDDCGDCGCGECCLKSLEWLNQEYKEEILSDEEKDIVKAMIEFIRKFGCEVNYFCKHKCANGDCFIQTTFKNIVTGSIEIMDSPYFNNDMFKGMKIYKKYKLEELGISWETQKDNYVRQ